MLPQPSFCWPAMHGLSDAGIAEWLRTNGAAVDAHHAKVQAHCNASMGFKWVVSPIETLAVCMSALQAMMKTFLTEGGLTDFMQDKASFEDLKSLLNLKEWQSAEADPNHARREGNNAR